MSCNDFTLPQGGSETSLGEFPGRAVGTPIEPPSTLPEGSFLAFDPPSGRVKSTAYDYTCKGDRSVRLFHRLRNTEPPRGATSTVPRPGLKRLLRISLRTTLVVVTLLCIMLAFKVRKVERQKEAVAWVEEMGGQVEYDSAFDFAGHRAELPGPKWLRDMIGVDYFDTVSYASFSDAQVDDLSVIANLTTLRELWLEAPQLCDLSPLAGLTELEVLSIRGTKVSNLSSLANLTKLAYLDLSDSQARDLSPLTNLAKLEHLDLSNAQASDEEISKLMKALPDCRIVR
jgi:Leucine-rich repeat (LRR) protein